MFIDLSKIENNLINNPFLGQNTKLSAFLSDLQKFGIFNFCLLKMGLYLQSK